LLSPASRSAHDLPAALHRANFDQDERDEQDSGKHILQILSKKKHGRCQCLDIQTPALKMTSHEHEHDHTIYRLCWLIFGLFWIISAFSVKPAKNARTAAALGRDLPLDNIFLFLAGISSFKPGWIRLNTRFWPNTLALAYKRCHGVIGLIMLSGADRFKEAIGAGSPPSGKPRAD